MPYKYCFVLEGLCFQFRLKAEQALSGEIATRSREVALDPSLENCDMYTFVGGGTGHLSETYRQTL